MARWRNKGLKSPDGDNFCEARKINNHGEIAVRAIPSLYPQVDNPKVNQSTAYVYHNGRWLNLGMDLGFGNAMNSSDQVAGRGEVNGDKTYMHALLWNKGHLIDLGRGTASAINNWGQVTVEDVVPYFWWRGNRKPLLVQGRSTSYELRDINDQGDVVGCDNASPNSHALLWHHFHELILNDCTHPGSGWLLLNATGINDRGQIVGNGVHNGKYWAFLLTPRQ